MTSRSTHARPLQRSHDTNNASTTSAGAPWGVHEYLADELERWYDCNQPRIERRRSWLGAAFALLGAVVVFLAIDLIIAELPLDQRVTSARPDLGRLNVGLSVMEERFRRSSDLPATSPQ